MKNKNVRLISHAFAAHLIALAVIMSHTHVRDIVAHASVRDSSAKLSTDVQAKAMSDLHNHIDKTSLKNVMKSAGDAAVVSRSRHTEAAMVAVEDSLGDVFERWLLFWRVVATIRA